MKICCNVKQGTSLVKNSSQTVEIKDKTNEKKPYLEQNISNHKLDGSDKKANTNTSPEMKISCNVKQGTSLVKNSSQTVEIKDKKNMPTNTKQQLCIKPTGFLVLIGCEEEIAMCRGNCLFPPLTFLHPYRVDKAISLSYTAP